MADAAHPEGNTFTFSSKIGSDSSIFYDHPEVSDFSLPSLSLALIVSVASVPHFVSLQILLTSRDVELKRQINGTTADAAPLPMAIPLTALSSTKKPAASLTSTAPNPPQVLQFLVPRPLS
jgi:hypothetical protein